jgi:hypothetical protein
MDVAGAAMSRSGPSGRLAPSFVAQVPSFVMAAQGTASNVVTIPGAPGDAVVASFISPLLPPFILVQEIQFISAGQLRIRLINTGPIAVTMAAGQWSVITLLAS